MSFRLYNFIFTKHKKDKFFTKLIGRVYITNCCGCHILAFRSIPLLGLSVEELKFIKILLHKNNKKITHTVIEK